MIKFVIIATLANGTTGLTPSGFNRDFESREVCEQAVRDLKRARVDLTRYDCITFDALNKGTHGK